MRTMLRRSQEGEAHLVTPMLYAFFRNQFNSGTVNILLPSFSFWWLFARSAATGCQCCGPRLHTSVSLPLTKLEELAGILGKEAGRIGLFPSRLVFLQ